MRYTDAIGLIRTKVERKRKNRIGERKEKCESELDRKREKSI